jgi:hypothetical protein
MINFKTAYGNFKLPQGYYDLTCREYKELRENLENPIKIIQILTGLDEVKSCLVDTEVIAQYIGFLQEPALDILEESDYLEIPCRNKTIFKKIGQCCYAQKITATKLLQAQDIESLVAEYSIDINVKDRQKEIEFRKELILDCKVDEAYSVAKYLINQLKEILERENELLSSNITEEQKRAGIESFNVLGEFNTIDMIAEKYKYTHKEVEELDYDLIFLILYKNKLTTNFEKNYSEILKEK